MAYFVPAEETLDGNALASLQRRRLGELLDRVRRDNLFHRERLRGVSFDPASDPLDRLPLTTRAEIERDQLEHPPYGSNLSHEVVQFVRLHQTSGSGGRPLIWLDDAESWSWWRRCWGIIYRAADVRAGDSFLFPFSFGPFIGFWGAFESAVALGHRSLPCGGMTTLARLEHMLKHGVSVVCCTPTYGLRMAAVAEEHGLDLAGSAVRALIVAGEPGGSIPTVRAKLERSWGARVFDHVGMTEVGPWGFECSEAPGTVHVMETDFIPEVIDPSSGHVLPEGESGELVLTNLGRPGSPLIRYRTGDQASLRRGRCACGRSFARVDGGIRGRIDDMLWIRGNNVFPSAIESIVREFEEVAEFRMRVTERSGMNELILEVETGGGEGDASIPGRLCERIRNQLHFQPRVQLVDKGTLPRFELKSRRLVRESPIA
ncbi:MAG: AMP-binding protein [Phycisphaerae bacterium]|nr:AMP-binding protein [Phycisphaerae bacterium]